MASMAVLASISVTKCKGKKVPIPLNSCVRSENSSHPSMTMCPNFLSFDIVKELTGNLSTFAP